VSIVSGDSDKTASMDSLHTPASHCRGSSSPLGHD
jgi:hypothetical protein